MQNLINLLYLYSLHFAELIGMNHSTDYILTDIPFKSPLVSLLFKLLASNSTVLTCTTQIIPTFWLSPLYVDRAYHIVLFGTLWLWNSESGMYISMVVLCLKTSSNIHTLFWKLFKASLYTVAYSCMGPLTPFLACAGWSDSKKHLSVTHESHKPAHTHTCTHTHTHIY